MTHAYVYVEEYKFMRVDFNTNSYGINSKGFIVSPDVIQNETKRLELSNIKFNIFKAIDTNCPTFQFRVRR